MISLLPKHPTHVTRPGPLQVWYFQIYVDGSISDERIDRIRHRLYEVEWESDEVIASIVRNKDDWISSLYQDLPFHQRVEQEGIRL
jgi:uncharacterized protein